jgi:hypothetical protein
MASGRRRIELAQNRPQGGWLARLLGRRGRKGEDVASAVPTPSPPPSVDFRLQHRAATRSVRAFVEAIDTYQLHTRSIVHVVSRYCVPPDSGLQERVPEWIAERVRFGVVPSEGEVHYMRIEAVDVQWHEEGTELYLHLDGKVVPGTRAFIAAYLGDGEGREEIRDIPPGLLHGEPG